MKNGKRSDLPLIDLGRNYGLKVESLGKVWHALKFITKDDKFIAFLDGQGLFRVRDDTFSKAGLVRFWTKADAVTWFDEFSIEVHSRDA